MKFAVSSEWVDLISLDAIASNFTIYGVNYFTVSVANDFTLIIKKFKLIRKNDKNIYFVAHS